MKTEGNNKKSANKVEQKVKTTSKKTTASTKTSKNSVKKANNKTLTTKKAETKNASKTKSVATKKVETKKPEVKKTQTKKAEAKKPEVKKVENKEKIVKDTTLISKKEKNENDKVMVKETFISNEEAKKVGIVLAIIIIIFGLFFLITKMLKKEDYSDIFVESLDVAEIQYTDILIGNMLKQSENEYYVLIENSEEEISEITYYAQNYQALYDKTKDYKMYTAQLNNVFNKKYYGQTDSYEANSLSFSKTTLVKVSNGSIVETYAQYGDIVNKLEELIGTV